MQIYRTLAWVTLLSNHVFAINGTIHNKSLNSESSNTDSAGTSNSNIQSSNFTFLEAVDPAFGFVPVFHGAQLPPVPCLLNSVSVALQLALEKFEEVMFETVFRLETHYQVEIAVTPEEEGGSVRRKFVVWGLNMGVSPWSCCPLVVLRYSAKKLAGNASSEGSGFLCTSDKCPAPHHTCPMRITETKIW